MKVRWFAGFLCALFYAASLQALQAQQAQSREAIFKAVSQSPDWTPSEQPAEYDSTNIEKFVGEQRAAALKPYGFVGATVQDWSGPDGKVRTTLFEMMDSTASYGAFTMERDRVSGVTRAPVGAEAFRTGNQLSFWQSKYLVTLDGPAAASEALGHVLSTTILGKSQKPTVALLLPPENLTPDSEKYVLEPAGVNKNLGLDTALLGFDSSVEIATARYRVDGKNAQLVLLLYPTQQIAKKYADQWDSVDPAKAGFRKRVSQLLALVVGVSDPAVAAGILDSVNYETQVTWNEGPPDIFLPDLILTIFTFIGVALAFTLVVGLSFGGLRIFVKSRYPDRVFDRAQDMEIIQLKLGQGFIHKELGE